MGYVYCPIPAIFKGSAKPLLPLHPERGTLLLGLLRERYYSLWFLYRRPAQKGKAAVFLRRLRLVQIARRVPHSHRRPCLRNVDETVLVLVGLEEEKKKRREEED